MFFIRNWFIRNLDKMTKSLRNCCTIMSEKHFKKLLKVESMDIIANISLKLYSLAMSRNISAAVLATHVNNPAFKKPPIKKLFVCAKMDKISC